MKTWNDILGDDTSAIDDCIDRIMDAPDDMCYAGHEAQSWPNIDKLLETYPWDQDPGLWLTIAVMSMVQPVHKSLEHYGPFYKEAARRLGSKAPRELYGFAKPV